MHSIRSVGQLPRPFFAHSRGSPPHLIPQSSSGPIPQPARLSGRRATGASLASLIAFCGIASAQSSSFAPWTHLGGDSARNAVLTAALPTLQPVWLCDVDDGNAPIAFNPGSTPIVLDGYVFALGFSNGSDFLYAIDRTSGLVTWKTGIPAPLFGSTSSPAIDVANNAVLLAASSELRAVHALTGATLWTVPLDHPIVNASPLVTDDLGPADRAFITDYDGFGSNGTLYCINVDPFDATLNPFHPGDLVWKVNLAASTFGCTPSYAAGIVYVPDSGSFAALPGSLRAFNATSVTPPLPLWRTMAPGLQSFSGGLAVVPSPQGTAILAATYNFSGGLLSSLLLKVDATTGALLWQTPSNRSNSIPIALGDGRIALSAGVEGFGSVPSVQLFNDLGSSASLVWDTALATWNDLNSNGEIDTGEYTPFAGYTLQPLVVKGFDSTHLIVGTLGSATAENLRVLDLSKSPSQTGFTVESFANAGESAAIANRVLYSFGADGLYAFGTYTCPADFTADGFVDDADFVAFAAAYENFLDPAADLTGDGITDDSDFVIFAAAYQNFTCP